ncbi:hypothetical protein ACFL2B_03015 [Patescibacteria group bacterium]
MPETDTKKAQQLGQLLAQSSMPADMKENILELLFIMKQEQIDKLISVLEQEQATYQETEKKFVDDLRNVENEYQNKFRQMQAGQIELLDKYIAKKLAQQS